MTGRVEGKVAFITGAARGQGRSHAVRLAREGADIIALDLCRGIDTITSFYPPASEADLKVTVKEVEALGRRIVARTADVRYFEQVSSVVAEGLEEFGAIDIVSANAGVATFGRPAHLVTEQEWTDVVGVNLTGVWHTVKAVVPGVIENRRGGSIIITSSSVDPKSPPNVAPYAASKHGLRGLVRTLALELAEHRIRVNSVHPGSVGTDMVLHEQIYRVFLPDEERPTKEQAAAVLQQGNALPVPWLEPEDISHAVLFLASEEARYVTGTEIRVDAGYAIK
jgi:SDR family mycofactocin-dependent oxidoreductase